MYEYYALGMISFATVNLCMQLMNVKFSEVC